MFLGRKNQYFENDYTAKLNLQIQCDPYQITNGIFHRTRTKKFTIHMETQKTPNSQSSLEKEEWSWRNQSSWLQIILQSYNHHDSMLLVQKKKFAIHMETRPWIANTVFRKKNGAGGINLPDQIILQTTVIKTVWYRHKNKNIDWWN